MQQNEFVGLWCWHIFNRDSVCRWNLVFFFFFGKVSEHSFVNCLTSKPHVAAGLCLNLGDKIPTKDNVAAFFIFHYLKKWTGIQLSSSSILVISRDHFTAPSDSTVRSFGILKHILGARSSDTKGGIKYNLTLHMLYNTKRESWGGDSRSECVRRGPSGSWHGRFLSGISRCVCLIM